MIRSQTNCYVWTESGRVYACAQLWLHALAPSGRLSPVLRLCMSAWALPGVFPYPPLKPTGETPGWTVTISPVITNKPHLSWAMIIETSQPRQHSFCLGGWSWTHFCQNQILALIAYYLMSKLPHSSQRHFVSCPKRKNNKKSTNRFDFFHSRPSLCYHELLPLSQCGAALLEKNGRRCTCGEVCNVVVLVLLLRGGGWRWLSRCHYGGPAAAEAASPLIVSWMLPAVGCCSLTLSWDSFWGIMARVGGERRSSNWD